jgi:succinylglutamate desuccinylase
MSSAGLGPGQSSVQETTTLFTAYTQACIYLKFAEATKDMDRWHLELISHILHSVTKRIERTPETQIRAVLQRLPLFQAAWAISCTIPVIRVRSVRGTQRANTSSLFEKGYDQASGEKMVLQAERQTAVKRYVKRRNWCSQLHPSEKEEWISTTLRPIIIFTPLSPIMLW